MSLESHFPPPIVHQEITDKMELASMPHVGEAWAAAFNSSLQKDFLEANGEDKVVVRLTWKKKYKKPLQDFNLDSNASLLFEVHHLKSPETLQDSLYFWKFYWLLAPDCYLP